MSEEWLALFPLKTVLFPDGPLRLQIFEPRYIEMVRDCTSQNVEFGVVLVVDDQSNEDGSTTTRIGTTARIVDFFTTDKGLLGIEARGESKFELLATRVRGNGLILGSIKRVPAEPGVPLDPAFGVLGTILQRLMEQAGDHYPDYDARLMDDASWVGCRLAEMLPLELLQKQVLLECPEPESRLEQLTRYLPDLQQQ